MSGYLIIRLGADSEAEIREIDSIKNYYAAPFEIGVRCKQVPKGVVAGDLTLIWLGTNNNKGTKTPWVQGIRALGKIKGVSGDGGYSEQKVVRVAIDLVFPYSITKMDIVTKASGLYPEIAAMPVIGVNNYSSQVVQRIDSTQPGQSMSALFAALELTAPGLKQYLDLEEIFDQRKHGDEAVDDQSISAPTTISTADVDNRENWLEDSDGLETEEDRSSEIEVPFDPTKIDIIAKSMTLGSLEGRLDNDELNLTPDFQRQANVWDAKRKARLIESILLKIPLPSFYFSEDTNGGYAVVDGLQRLCAVFHFKNAALLNAATGANLLPLRLKGLQYLKDLEGKLFSELDRKFQRRIEELEIAANIIRANTPSAVKFNVFARLNQGGLPLNAQEIRNAIFPGEWRNELRSIAEGAAFRQATEGKIRTQRQQDMELVLRYVALWQLGSEHRRPANQTLDEFLNVTVEQSLSRWNPSSWAAARDAFERAVEVARTIRGKHAFRRSLGTYPRAPINRGLFEAELIVFGNLSDAQVNHLIERRAELEANFLMALRQDLIFIDALSLGTGSAESSNARIDVWQRIVKETLVA